MRKISSLGVVLGVVLLSAGLAHAATEVARYPANNRFASAVSNAPDGTTTAVFVTRELTGRGGPVDSIFFIISEPDGSETLGSGVLPKGAFHFDAHSASVNVDINDITLDFQIGVIPANGVIAVKWTATDVERTSGSTTFNFDTTHVVIAGTRVDVTSTVAGTVFGAPLVDASGTTSSVTQSVIIVTRD